LAEREFTQDKDQFLTEGAAMHARWCELSIDTVDLQCSAILFVPWGKDFDKPKKND
jgi:hypothetical protein